MRFSEEVKNAVKKEYFDGELTVDQIASKYSVARRTVYAWVGTGHNRKRSGVNWGSIRMTAKEMELVILSLLEMDVVFDRKADLDAKAISMSLQNRLLGKIDEIDACKNARG